MTTITYTRAEYLNATLKGTTLAEKRALGAVAHRRYFGQFVTPATIARVVNSIGADRLMASTDPHMNDIPLALWDRLVPHLPGSEGFAAAGDYYTQSHGVCLAKEAARQYVESRA